MRTSLAFVVLLAACAPTVSTSDDGTGDEGKADALENDPASVRTRLKALPNVVSVTPFQDTSQAVPSRAGCTTFRIEFRQPVDHGSANGPTFNEQLVLQHCNATAPMVFSPDGYGFDVDFFQPELVGRLNSNWLWAEHRYFGPSTPASDPNGTYLTVRQSADDHHAIVSVFKAMYPRRWISTGASNGGMNAVFHRRFYPNDVDGTVAYVAPLVNGAPDVRFIPFVDALGTRECRDKLLAFQRDVLQRVDEIAPTLPKADYADASGSLTGAAFGYRFTFWQYGGNCDSIPAAGSAPGEITLALAAVNVLSPDQQQAGFSAYYAQTSTELGYPAQSRTGLEDLWPYGPDEAPATYSPDTLNGVIAWVRDSGSRIIFVYGGHDPWTAAVGSPSPARDNLVVYAPDHGHEADLTMLSDDDRAHVLDRLAAWTGTSLEQPKALQIDADRLGRRRAAAAFETFALRHSRRPR